MTCIAAAYFATVALILLNAWARPSTGAERWWQDRDLLICVVVLLSTCLLLTAVVVEQLEQLEERRSEQYEQ